MDDSFCGYIYDYMWIYMSTCGYIYGYMWINMSTCGYVEDQVFRAPEATLEHERPLSLTVLNSI